MFLLRKPKSCVLSARVQKIADLRPYMLATVLARQHDVLSEQTLMVLGGELFELRRHALASFKAGDTHESLSIRMDLTKDLQQAEKRWRDRLIQLLELGWGPRTLKTT